MSASAHQLFYRDKPIFGLDLGFNSVKVMQITTGGKKPVINGYGSIRFDSAAVSDGAITNHDLLAKSVFELFDKHIIGTISTRRVAATIPAVKAYSRIMELPTNLSRKELDEAVRFEAEQYIPISLDDLYLDYTLSTNGENSQVVVVAVPKKIIDSYMNFFKVMGLEVCSLETTITASSRLIATAENSNVVPTILVDCGSLSVDLTINDQFLIVNGTVPGGGDNFTQRIAEKLHVGHDEAVTIKTKYGLGYSKKQAEISEALKPQLDLLLKEIRRVIRYYEDRTGGKRKIGQIITMGGGANMPGFSDYLTDNLRLATRMCDFWQSVSLGNLKPPNSAEKSVYVTVAGAAMLNPKEIWS